MIWAAIIRTYCTEFCYCGATPKSQNREYASYKYAYYNLNGRYTSVRAPDGSMDIVDDQEHKWVQKILPAQPDSQPGSNAAGLCGVHSDKTCPGPWNEALLGPLEISNGDLNEPAKQAQSTELDRCGNKCQGPKDCAASNHEQTCFCAVPGPSDAHKLGLDPVSPSAVCLIVAAAVVKLKDGLMGKRDMSKLGMQCLCNTTYISPTCCNSSDGMIFEDSASNLLSKQET